MKETFLSTALVDAKAMTYREFLEAFAIKGKEFPLEEEGYCIQIDEESYEWIPTELFEEDMLYVGDLEGLAPHQQRIMVDRTQLFERYQKLGKTLNSSVMSLLPVPERELLKTQHRVMKSYLDILDKRIALFTS